jgi:hypothetical protein
VLGTRPKKCFPALNCESEGDSMRPVPLIKL